MNDDDIFLATQYADNELGPEERREFERRLAGNAELREYVDTYLEAQAVLTAKFREDETRTVALRNTLSEMNARHFAPETKVVFMRPAGRWAAGIAAALLVGLLVFQPWKDNLYEKYSEGTTMSLAERGETKSPLQVAADRFNKKDFKAAAGILDTEYKRDTSNALAGYYLAICLVETGELSQARPILERLYNGASVYKYDAAWHLALSFLKEGDKANCKNWLEKIPEGTAAARKAASLKADLD